jgi:trigger factor
LKLEVTPVENHQVKLTIEADNEQVDRAKQKAAKKLSSKSRIPGFRPGKAPYAVILKQFGEETIFEESIEILANEIYQKALDEAEIRPFGPGTLQNINSREPLILEFLIPLDAKVTLGEYHSIRIPYQSPSISDDEVNEVLSRIGEQNAIIEPVERSVQVGDLVTVKIDATRTEDSESRPLSSFSNQSLPVVVKEDSSDQYEWPFPGFSMNLVGLTNNQTITIQHTFSDESIYKSLQGVDAAFEVAIEEIKSRTIPQFDDAFAQSVGEFKTMDDLKAQIKQDLLNQKLRTYNSEYTESVLTQIIDISEINYPNQMLERELDTMIREIEGRLENQRLDMDLYLKSRQMDITSLRDEIKPTAETRLKRSLILYELADKEKIKVSPEQLQEETTLALQSLSQTLPQNEAKKLKNRDIMANVMNNVLVELLLQQTQERIRNIASGNWQPESSEMENNVEIVVEQPSQDLESNHEKVFETDNLPDKSNSEEESN